MKKVLCLIGILAILVACVVPSMAFAENQYSDSKILEAWLCPIDSWSDVWEDCAVRLDTYAFPGTYFNLNTLQRAYAGNLPQFLDDIYGFAVAFKLSAGFDYTVSAFQYCSSLNLPTNNIVCSVITYHTDVFLRSEWPIVDVLDNYETSLTLDPFELSNTSNQYAIEYMYGSGDPWILFFFYNGAGNNFGINLDPYFEGYDFPLYSFPNALATVESIKNTYSDYDIAFGEGKNSAETNKYNQGYNAGVSFADGRLNIDSYSYIFGFSDGTESADNRNNPYSVSYNQGRLAGLRESEEYSFMGLMSAVVDAPIQAGLGLFNFEILGVNMKGIYTALFTACVVIIVVKFVLAK